MITDDPTLTDPDHYCTLWENEHVRVLDYIDRPGDRTRPHDHPNSVLIALTDFTRRLMVEDQVLDTALTAGQAVWLPAQRHAGENTGSTPTHTILVELKGEAAGSASNGTLGPREVPGIRG